MYEMATTIQLKKLIMTAKNDVLRTKNTFSLQDLTTWINTNTDVCVTRQQVRSALIALIDESNKK